MMKERYHSLATGNLTNLTTLNLELNNIGEAAQKALESKYPNADISF